MTKFAKSPAYKRVKHYLNPLCLLGTEYKVAKFYRSKVELSSYYPFSVDNND